MNNVCKSKKNSKTIIKKIHKDVKIKEKAATTKKKKFSLRIFFYYYCYYFLRKL